MRQFGSTLRKNAIEKRRNLAGTCCEYFSHFVLFLILVFAFRISVVTNFQPESYVKLNVVVPPPFLRVSKSTGPTFTDDDVGHRGALAQNDSSNKFQIQLRPLLAGVKKQLKGPVPIPSFDTYMAATNFISNSANQLSEIGLIRQTSIGMAYGNLLDMGDLHFSPYPSHAVDSLIDYLNRTTTSFKTLTYQLHASEAVAVDFILNHLDRRTLALIVIRQITPDKINYVIRQNYSTLPNTNQVLTPNSRGLDNNFQKYLISGFLTIQSTIDRWALDYAIKQVDPNATCFSPNVLTVPSPTYNFDSNQFYGNIGSLVGFAMTMSTIYPVSRLIKSIVEEKESRMREVMKIMGLNQFSYQLSWFVTSLIVFLWITITSTYVAHTSFLPNTNMYLLFLYFLLFSISEITLCFLIATFFTNSKLAAIVGPVVLFVSILPKYVFYGSNVDESTRAKYAASLFSPTAFAFGADILTSYEYSGRGVQFTNMSENNYSMVSVFQMLTLDIFIYSFLAWYLDQVLLNDLRTPKHFLFLFNPYYWCPFLRKYACSRPADSARLHILPPEMIFSASSELCPDKKRSDNTDVEKIPENILQNVKVVACGLEKVYPGGKVAVKDFSLAMMEGQVTCLLGHNGAGKSSTIAMITGLAAVTAGECIVYGHSIPSAMNEVRTLIGFCPQQNILFPTLTVQEHLRFFGCIKGIYGMELKMMVEQMILDIGLVSKRDTFSSSLSGGMKRRLQLGIAMIGGSKFLILDEPTSGMDPCSRRSMWELVQRNKSGRVTLLTTHFLDEAEILGDRIAIMSEGKIRCSGSSSFLKSTFGAGYTLSISISLSKAKGTSLSSQSYKLKEFNNSNCKNDMKNIQYKNIEKEFPKGDEESINFKSMGMEHSLPVCDNDYDSLECLVKSFIPSAICISKIAGENIFSLPRESVQVFAELFKTLKEKSEPLGTSFFSNLCLCLQLVIKFIRFMTDIPINLDPGIESYGVSITNLERIFIKLAEEEEKVKRNEKAEKKAKEVNLVESSNIRSSSFYSTLQRTLCQYAPTTLLPFGRMEGQGWGWGRGSSPQCNPPLKSVHQKASKIYSIGSAELRIAPSMSARSLHVDACGSEKDDDKGNGEGDKGDLANITTATISDASATAASASSSSSSSRLKSEEDQSKFFDIAADKYQQPHPSKCAMTSECVPIDILQDVIEGEEKIEVVYVQGEVRKWEKIDDDDEEEEEDEEMIKTGNIQIQILELLYKRFLITSRDLKGLFFQIVFPALQVLFILAMLNILIRQPGRTLKMNAGIFKFKPDVMIAGSLDSKSRVNRLSVDRMNIHRFNASTSEILSSDLLQSENSLLSDFMSLKQLFPASDRRLGGIVREDTLALHINVDWDWVKANYDLIIDVFGLTEVSNLIDEILLFDPNANPSQQQRALSQSIRIPSSVIRDIVMASSSSSFSSISSSADLFDSKSKSSSTSFSSKKFASSSLHRKYFKDVVNDFGILSKLNRTVINRFLNSNIFHSIFSSNLDSVPGSSSGSDNYIDSLEEYVNVHYSKISTYEQIVSIENIRITKGKHSVQIGDTHISLSRLKEHFPDGVKDYKIDLPISHTVMHNTSSPHGIAAFRGEIIAAKLQECYSELNTTKQNNGITPRTSYLAKNHPLPSTSRQSLQDRIYVFFLAALFLLIPLCYIPASFVTMIVKERISKSKHIQLASFVSPFVYWISAFIWDMLLFLLLVLLIIIVLFIFGKSSAQVFVSVREATYAVFILLITYGMSALPLCYLYSMRFDNHSAAQIFIISVNFATGFIAVGTYFIMLSVPATVRTAGMLVQLFRIFPPYNIGEGLIAVSTAYFEGQILGEHGVHYLDWSRAGSLLVKSFRRLLSRVLIANIFMYITFLVPVIAYTS